MKTVILFRLLFLLLASAIGTAVARAEDLGAVRARIEQRIGAIDALKGRKVVGENNRGYLEARGSVLPADERVISDENADRREVYKAIAAQEKVAIEQVGRLRAQKIALNSTRGVWLQGPDGVWYQKS